MKKIEKKELIKFLTILATIVLICINFLQMHYSSDTFVLYRLGYFDYPSEYFLQDGRLISTLFCYIGGILHLPIPVYVIAMDFIGMVFLSIAIYIISKLFVEIIKPDNTIKEILIYLASFILILNQYTLEYLLFPESAVMCLGMLFTVLAIKEFVSKRKYKYLKIFIYLFLTGVSYQGELNIFPMIAILVLIIKQVKEQKSSKKFIKSFIKELLKISGICILVIGICFIIIKISGNIFGVNKKSFVLIRDGQSFRRKLNWVKFFAKDILINCISMFPKYSLLICPVITIILLIIGKSKTNTIINYLFYILISFASVILPLFLVTAGVCARLSLPAMMIFGGSSLILIANLKDNVKKCIEKITCIFVMLLFLINARYIIINTTEHIAANKIDAYEGRQIKALIDNYEKENGNKITKFAFAYDPNPQQFAPGIKPMQSLTERKLACIWCIKYAMEYYCERNLELEDYYYSLAMKNDNKGMTEYNNQKDYTCFSEDQIMLIDDTVYMIVY